MTRFRVSGGSFCPSSRQYRYSWHGLGCRFGWTWSAAAVQITGLAPDEYSRLHAREAVQIILALWTQDEATFEGTYYQYVAQSMSPKECKNRISHC